MDWMSLIPGAASALGGGTQPGTSSSATGELNDRTVINVAPVGINLGALLQPLNEGSPANGGFGVDIPSRYIPISTGLDTLAEETAKARAGSFLWPAALALGAGVLLVYFMKDCSR
jgi:hypothetical protein